MLIPKNVIVNADDLGFNNGVNQAILQCYQQGIINSTSLLVNMPAFDDALQTIRTNPVINNIGIHINLAEGKPLVFNNQYFLTPTGHWDLAKTNKKLRLLGADDKQQFLKEIYAQVDKALAANITLTHIDSHYHLHTLPCFYGLFLQAAKRYNLKIRLAQTYREGSYIKYWVRRYINSAFFKSKLEYTKYFETVDEFVKRPQGAINQPVEVMLHPQLDAQGKLTDHVDAPAMVNWLAYLKAM